jgi:UPF0755 protein
MESKRDELKPSEAQGQPKPQPIMHEEHGITPVKKKKRGLLIALIAAAAFVVAFIVTAGVFYCLSLQPVDASNTAEVAIEIPSGTTPDEIATKLKEADVIRNTFTFSLYTRMNGVRNSLQAGMYHLKKSQSLAEIVDTLVKGPTVEEIEITFFPGATLEQDKAVLVKAGYSESDVDAAFAAKYSHPVFEGKPDTADLEGYLYGETHRFFKGAPLEDILTRYFDDLYAVVEENDLIAQYKAKGLTLYEGITLASIIQRESGGGDQAQIAQVFLTRLSIDMPLGSDVTYQYIADKLGVPRDVNLDNPYNTRRFGGLPPGPISAPGEAALLAVAQPAEGDYLYFLSGDDGVTYFAKTEAEHQQNIQNHCQQKCQIL